MADTIDMFAASKKLRSAARWRRMYEEALRDGAITNVCLALNQMGQSIRVARGDLFVQVVVEAEPMAAVEALAQESSVDDVVEGAFTLAGGRLYRESERLFVLAPREVVTAHPDFSGLYGSGAAMGNEMREVFRRLGISLVV